MSFAAILTLSFALAMDAFAVSIGISIHLRRATLRQIFRVAWHFGLFQFSMPLAGFYVGAVAGAFVSTWAHVAAFLLLCVIGVRMMMNALPGRRDEDRYATDPTRGLTLISLMLATSLDALAAGISISLIHNEILKPAVLIGIVAFLLSVVGMVSGPRIGLLFGKRAELAGGGVLVALGIKILLRDLILG